MERFFSEFYSSQIEGRMNDYVLNHWSEALDFFDDQHEKMDSLIEVATQCIASNNKEIYDMYVTNLLIEKGVLK